MKTATELVTNIDPCQTKTTTFLGKFSNTEQVFATVWRGLQSGRHISKAEKLRGTEYTYWRNRLADLTDEQLLAGLDASDDFTGYMTVSAFKKCCLEGCKVEGAHKVHVPLARKKASQEVVERFRQKRIAALGETKDFAATLHGEKQC